MTSIRCLHDWVDAVPLRDAINQLNLASARPDPFSTFEFYSHYLRHLIATSPADVPRLWLLLAFDGDRLVGYMALKQTTHRVLGRRCLKLDWLTAHHADRPHLVARIEHEEAMAAAFYRYLIEPRQQWSLLEFQQQDDDSPLLPLGGALAHRRLTARCWPNMANGTIALSWSTLADYCAELPHKVRSNVRRQMRNLMAAGHLQLLGSDDPQLTPLLFALYRHLEAHSWKHEAAATLDRDGDAAAYYAGLMEGGQPMKLRIQLLLLDGLPVAGLICGEFNQASYALQIAYDARLSPLAPGSAMLLFGIESAIDRGSRVFNLLWGFGYYKQRWLARMTPTQSLQIFRIGTPFWWRRILGDLRRHYRGGEDGDPTARHNPARDGLHPIEPAARRPDSAHDTKSTLADRLADADERVRIAAVVARYRLGGGECRSAADIARRLPFNTERVDPKPARRLPSSPAAHRS
ncbi:Acetyltransferase (GNAT) domain-containing protein [Hydrocarboniphaga daqingensis]|uniref:Acetyltransferase (GNAT) domain-containing protein n=1 Tax=Hydrocarboniphaga daqingensis TaxID=490188 RepID=A0A1M5PCI9_9GAMM|nr:GNAT family N-acetyltransferase [Hydrocarboniphaga daqingensis]SHG98953.1 Acetyltransferase (GNAT) domain-containing protein [Hydrocarboniphaga daqingensis]